MPYVDASVQNMLDVSMDPQRAGELNYCITKLCVDFLGSTPRYSNFNEVIGALECAKLEMYRRMIAPYEDIACAKNGDVYNRDV